MLTIHTQLTGWVFLQCRETALLVSARTSVLLTMALPSSLKRDRVDGRSIFAHYERACLHHEQSSLDHPHETGYPAQEAGRPPRAQEHLATLSLGGGLPAPESLQRPPPQPFPPNAGRVSLQGLAGRPRASHPKLPGHPRRSLNTAASAAGASRRQSPGA